MQEWEEVGEGLSRIKIDGGWIYALHRGGIGQASIAFVPFTNAERAARSAGTDKKHD